MKVLNKHKVDFATWSSTCSNK